MIIYYLPPFTRTRIILWHLKMYLLLKMVIVHCHVSFRGGNIWYAPHSCSRIPAKERASVGTLKSYLRLVLRHALEETFVPPFHHSKRPPYHTVQSWMIHSAEKHLGHGVWMPCHQLRNPPDTFPQRPSYWLWGLVFENHLAVLVPNGSAEITMRVLPLPSTHTY